MSQETGALKERIAKLEDRVKELERRLAEHGHPTPLMIGPMKMVPPTPIMPELDTPKRPWCTNCNRPVAKCSCGEGEG